VTSNVMRMRTLAAVCGALLSAVTIFAQAGGEAADPISGNWGSDGLTFLELKFDGKSAVSGTTIWRGRGEERRAPIQAGAFDLKTGVLKLQGEGKGPDDTSARYVIEGKVDRDTVTGTYSFGSAKGDFTFRKLTAPRS